MGKIERVDLQELDRVGVIKKVEDKLNELVDAMDYIDSRLIILEQKVEGLLDRWARAVDKIATYEEALEDK